MGKKTQIIFILTILFFYSRSILSANSKIGFPELVNPNAIFVKDNKIYIVEKSKILIFGLDNYKLIKSFGKQGEGPEEFKLNPDVGYKHIFVNMTGNEFIITSSGKFSVFSDSGKFKYEMRIPEPLSTIKKIEDRFVAWNNKFENKTYYWIIEILDSKLKKLNEIFKTSNMFQIGKGLQVLSKKLMFGTLGNKIYVTDSKEFRIDFYNSKGINVKTILNKKFKKKSFTKKDEASWLEDFRINNKLMYDRLKNQIHFPKFYPAIHYINSSDNCLLVFTFNKIDGKTECFIYDQNCHLLQKTYIKMLPENSQSPSPFTFMNGTLYQLLFNEDNDNWELHISYVIK